MKKKTPTAVKDQKKDKTQNFVIDCSKPVEDKVFVTSTFAQYLTQRIKVHGKIGQLGQNIKIKAEDSKVNVMVTSIDFSKRYLKYLTKKYLKKHSLRQFLYVIAKDKKTYQIKYFNIQQQEGGQD